MIIFYPIAYFAFFYLEKLRLFQLFNDNIEKIIIKINKGFNLKIINSLLTIMQKHSNIEASCEHYFNFIVFLIIN